MKKIVLFSHGGSGNRGCEAIVRSTRNIIGDICGDGYEYYLCSLNEEEDKQVEINQFNDIVQYKNSVSRYSLEHFYANFKYKVTGTTDQYISYGQKSLYKHFGSDSLALSIGGDNYCYTDSKWLHVSHREAKKRKTKTVLWGCSLEEGNMNKEMLEDLRNYDLIIARESITYETLLKYGINKATKLYPDPAFQLNSKEVNLPDGFMENNTVGINLSPYIYKSSLPKETVINIYINFIEHIINTCDMQIALIPHVFWSQSRDLDVLEKVYTNFKNSNRVIIVRENLNCMQLKYLISKCRFFIGARTHSTIAAYSSCIPTLVIGYSVKSIGIARDIFGSEENMVIPVQNILNKGNLIEKYNFLRENEQNIKDHLKSFMPVYKEKAKLAGEELNKLIKVTTFS
ncbi:polysaccharide pyruvyl transferase family protein [Robertmurraya sp.]|uniref:polysaccharide pyruvyl transferase family protein n=1 Tax=Robertmurraya sp. TaxID=2837525 RepID=UPI003703B684